MTSSKRPKVDTPPEPAPAATPIPGRVEEEAKKKARRRSGGRASTVFAGQLNQQRGGNGQSILKTRLG